MGKIIKRYTVTLKIRMPHFFDRKETGRKETPDLTLRNHISVSISHKSLKLTYGSSSVGTVKSSFCKLIFIMLVKSFKQWAQTSEIQHLWIAPKRSVWVMHDLQGYKGATHTVTSVTVIDMRSIVAECVWALASSRGGILYGNDRIAKTANWQNRKVRKWACLSVEEIKDSGNL